MPEPVIPPSASGRGFSKAVLAANTGLAWCALAAGIALGQSEHVVGPTLTFIAGRFGTYAGVGHLDMRTSARVAAQRQVLQRGCDPDGQPIEHRRPPE